jgi:magnesium transporter
VQGHLILTNCLTDEVTRPAIERALNQKELLWLDLEDTGPDTIALLREVFKIHPLAVEDVQEFNQRPKIEEYDDFVSIVAFGAHAPDQPLAELHAFYADQFLVTVHRESIPAVGTACHALTRVPENRRLVALYRVLDSLVDSMFPYLAALDDRIDELQDQIIEDPQKEQLTELFAIKRQLVGMRKLVTPQRDLVSSIVSQVVPLPGMTPETERYVRDLYDHLIRIGDMVDSYRDLLGGSLDAYMSMVSNKMNEQMKQLTIIATVFLPLSFLTGFFGQNFAWLLNNIGSPAAFFVIGLGTEVVAVASLLLLFKRRGWM